MKAVNRFTSNYCIFSKNIDSLIISIVTTYIFVHHSTKIAEKSTTIMNQLAVLK